MKCDELESFTAETFGYGKCEVYDADEVDAAIAELKQKLHDAEMQADLAECAVTEYKIDYDKLNDKNRRLKRALWRAIALFCARSCEYFSGIMSHCLMGQEDLYRRCEEKKNKYLHATYKCRAKMEEYK